VARTLPRGQSSGHCSFALQARSIPAARINLPLARRMPALALNIRNLFHRFTLHAAIFLIRMARTIRMRALLRSVRHGSSFPLAVSILASHQQHSLSLRRGLLRRTRRRPVLRPRPVFRHLVSRHRLRRVQLRPALHARHRVLWPRRLLPNFLSVLFRRLLVLRLSRFYVLIIHGPTSLHSQSLPALISSTKHTPPSIRQKPYAAPSGDTVLPAKYLVWWNVRANFDPGSARLSARPQQQQTRNNRQQNGRTQNPQHPCVLRARWPGGRHQRFQHVHAGQMSRWTAAPQRSRLRLGLVFVLGEFVCHRQNDSSEKKERPSPGPWQLALKAAHCASLPARIPP